ncbi:hypothetical protein DFJ63DRAFT_314634 [Scheffersomyces coipomensis]|uniref:uncharacterized protein n=1 Tax=Scheffersomyces coipomensis TaxID=1788519 RepID=UPI00315CDBE7
MSTKTFFTFIIRFFQFAIGAVVMSLTADITAQLGNIKKVTLVMVIGIATVIFTGLTLSGLLRKVPVFYVLLFEIILNYFWVIAFSLVADTFGDIDYSVGKWPKEAISLVAFTLVNWLLFIVTNIIFVSEVIVPLARVYPFRHTYTNTTHLQWGALYPVDAIIPDEEARSEVEPKDVTSTAPTAE